MINTRSLNKKNIEITENEYRINKKIVNIEINKCMTIINRPSCKKIKVKNFIRLIKITDLYSSIIFNRKFKNNLLSFAEAIKIKYLMFVETEHTEKELVYECKKFLDKHYDDINFNLKCEAYTLNGSQCKNYKKEKQFCYIHDGKFVTSITEILNSKLSLDIARICTAKLF